MRWGNLFGMISFSSYVNIETVNIIFFDVLMNKVLANNPSNSFISFF